MAKPKPPAAEPETARDVALKVCNMFINSYPVLYSPQVIDRVAEIIERYASRSEYAYRNDG